MAFSERVSRLKSSLIREILAAAQRPEVMSFAGGLPAEAMLPKVEWADMPLSMGQYGMSEGEPYRELTFDGGSATPIVSRLNKASWIYTGTVSKTLLPGLRVGYLIASPDLFPHLLRLKQSADLHTNRIGQWQALQWIGTEKYQQHLGELRGFYRVRRDAFQSALETHFSDLAQWNVPQGGLFFWLTLKQPLDTRTLLRAALAADVAFMPGEPFFPEPDKNPGYMRLNFSHIDPARLDEGLKRLATVVSRAQAAQAA